MKEHLLRLAEANGARRVPEAERPHTDVPFTFIPMYSTPRSGLPKNMQKLQADAINLSTSASPLRLSASSFELLPLTQVGTRDDMSLDELGSR